MRPIRTVALALGLAVVALGAAAGARADEPQWRTGASLLGSPKHDGAFAHFDYADPQAPQGGLLRLSATGTFDSFNPVIPKGSVAGGVAYIYEKLMTPALDEV